MLACLAPVRRRCMLPSFQGWGCACCPTALSTRRAARHVLARPEPQRLSRRMRVAVPTLLPAWPPRLLRGPVAECVPGILATRQKSWSEGPRLLQARQCARLACVHAGLRKPPMGLKRCRLQKGALMESRRVWTQEVRGQAVRLPCT